MNKQRKKTTIIALLEQLLPVILAMICILVMTVNSNQAMLAIPFPLSFEGEYSLDGGESWQVLTAESDLSTNQGDLLLRGHFDEELFPGGILYLYRDHFGITIERNGERYYQSIQSEILMMGDAGKQYRADTCGREWVQIEFEDGLLTTDTVEIHLQKMHDYIDRNAYRNFLDSCYIGPIDTMIVEAYLQPHVTPWMIFGGFLLLVAAMMLGATVAAVFFQTSMTQNLSKLGFLLLFAGGYLLLDTITVTFWSETQVFNTYARHICMMLLVYWMGLVIRDMLTGPRYKIAKVVLEISLVLNVVLILPSFTGAWAIYDTLPVWAAGQIIFTVTLLGASVGELWKQAKNNWLDLCSCVLLLVTLLLDMAGVGNSMYSHGTCTKVAFALLFVIHGFRALKRALVDYQGARRAKKLEKELEDSRIAIMLSQMQPHFIYNTLGTIERMCLKDPEKAFQLVRNFSLYLRGNFSELDSVAPIRFSDELKHIEYYVNIEKVRFPDMTIEYDVETTDFVLPALSVQPLVENAIKHGLMRLESGGTVVIRSYETPAHFCVEVKDDGVGFDTSLPIEEKKHVGLRNIRGRLKAMVNGELVVESQIGIGTRAVILIPKE